MKLHQYASYEEYVAAQVEGNQRKINNVWARPETIDRIVMFALNEVQNILCHGTRNGAEQKMFKRHYPRAFVTGTEIAPTAGNYEYTVQHDFHDPREEWKGLFDIVYSNSFDHAFDPRRALETWREQLAPGGRLFLELGISEIVNRSTPTDPLEIDAAEVFDMLQEVGLRVLRTFPAYGVKANNGHISLVYVTERA